MIMTPLYARQQKRYRTDFWTMWEKARVDSMRLAFKHVYYRM